jgi:hypothetical protein
MHEKPSFAGRIVLALLLMVIFYCLALALAGTLIFLPIGMAMFANRIHLKLAILSFIGGCMILWSVLPRWDRFVAPGPQLTEKDQPELFRQLLKPCAKHRPSDASRGLCAAGNERLGR